MKQVLPAYGSPAPQSIHRWDRMPAVSVCIPAYNARRFIDKAVRSVLSQSLSDLELIIVDDASQDGTAEAAEAYGDDRVRLFRNPANIGAAANWNRAVGFARGRFVKVLCGDDLLGPDCLARQVEILETHPHVALVAGRRNVIDENGRVLIPGRGLGRLRGVVPGSEAVRATVRAGTNLFGEPACVLLRRDLVARCGPFSDRRQYMLDVDYWCRMLRFGALFAQQDTVAAFRISAQAWSVELARHQSAQAAELFGDLRRDDPAGISAFDLACGRLRAGMLAAARSAGYRALSLSRAA
jgi:glycosyltransferase involved in cell wall biosynthesis